MLLLVGLGNPGARYAGTRHNIGFMAVQEIAKRHGIGPWRPHFQELALACNGSIDGTDVLLLLPGTFMNESGRAVAAAVKSHRLSLGDIIVFHAYASTTGHAYLQISTIAWIDGWPKVALEGGNPANK